MIYPSFSLSITSHTHRFLLSSLHLLNIFKTSSTLTHHASIAGRDTALDLVSLDSAALPVFPFCLTHRRFADIHYYLNPPISRPLHHRMDKGSYVYLYHNSQGRTCRLEVANAAGTPEQDAFDGCESCRSVTMVRTISDLLDSSPRLCSVQTQVPATCSAFSHPSCSTTKHTSTR